MKGSRHRQIEGADTVRTEEQNPEQRRRKEDQEVQGVVTS
jgi:hypothetical protein